MTRHVFEVAGTATPQGSMRPIRSATTGRTFAKHSNAQKLAAWRADVREAAQRAIPAVIDGPIVLDLDFVFSRPASHTTATGKLRKGRGRAHVQKPDLDKLIRAVGDALTGVAYVDDAQIVKLYAAKRWAVAGERPGLLVEIVEWKVTE